MFVKIYYKQNTSTLSDIHLHQHLLQRMSTTVFLHFFDEFIAFLCFGLIDSKTSYSVYDYIDYFATKPLQCAH